jgi:dihydroxyacetone kinase-like predicted kinase
MLKLAILSGAKRLETNKDWINDLNVFPVPDGDTGTNMTLTIMAAAKEVAGVEEITMEKIAKAMSSGSLRGARGNSGVILSQLFRGFARHVENFDEINAQVLADALVKASETAYKAVMKPKEGTILTVARIMAERAQELIAEVDEAGGADASGDGMGSGAEGVSPRPRYADGEDMLPFLEAIIAAGDEALERTPELLPVLKQAGVVDSGGQGLMQVLKGALDGLLGKETAVKISPEPTKKSFAPGKTPVQQRPSIADIETSDIKFGYCTEFIINAAKAFTDEDEDALKTYLSSIGDSLVCVSDGEVVKIHVHTNDPGLAIQKGLSYGPLSRMKIDNMREEHEERLLDEMRSAGELGEGYAGGEAGAGSGSGATANGTGAGGPHGESGGAAGGSGGGLYGTGNGGAEAGGNTGTGYGAGEYGNAGGGYGIYGTGGDGGTIGYGIYGGGAAGGSGGHRDFGFIAVSVGGGLGEIFRGIGADELIEGGQTMNPSTQDMLDAIDRLDADVIYIFPNNKNIILAAQQAQALTEGKEIVVVPSKTVPQGIAALVNFLPDLSPDENLANMQEEMRRVRSGQITYAVRSTSIDGFDIEEGDVMGLGDHGLIAVGKDVAETAFDTTKALVEDDTELVTIYYGADVTEGDAEALAGRLREACPHVEVELQNGGQPVYYYLVSAE